MQQEDPRSEKKTILFFISHPVDFKMASSMEVGLRPQILVNNNASKMSDLGILSLGTGEVTISRAPCNKYLLPIHGLFENYQIIGTSPIDNPVGGFTHIFHNT